MFRKERAEIDPKGGPMDQLVALSRFLGSGTEFVIAGGGNTSLKTADRLFVKASGASLASVEAAGFVEMYREPLGHLLGQDLGPDVDEREARFKEAILAARVHPEQGLRPSVECVLHNMLPRRFVVHTHPKGINVVTCCERGEAMAGKIFDERVLWVPYVDPGFTLARLLSVLLAEYTRRTGRDCPALVLMQNHGLIVCGDTPDDILDHTEWVLNGISAQMPASPTREVFGPKRRIGPERGRSLINQIGPTLRALLADDERLKTVTFDDSDVVLDLVASEHGKAAALAGPLTPDQIVYCRSLPLWIGELEDSDPKSLLSAVRGAIRAHRDRAGVDPLVVLAEGLGMFCAGDDFAQAKTVRLAFKDAIEVMGGAQLLGGIRWLPQRESEFIEHWEVEAFRRRVSSGKKRGGRAAGLISMITGAAQGFGLEIARDLAAEGASVVLCDVNEAQAQAQARALSSEYGPGRAEALSMDVTDLRSVAQAVDNVVRRYGGVDLLISNAGVLRAGSVKTLPAREFDLVTSVNYKGYFLLVQNVAPVMSLQHLAKPDYWSDIIQINSKSGLAGSNRNAAYAGSKFGGIGLTQSFALEVIEDGIKVNAICPGNYFDGPLWSDPETGLFVQYLRTGKVPGARTVADVRSYYEARVPMKRGCTAADLMTAVYYLISQKYETGQALPVTGGQIMLG